jgi:hypothetical protein
MKTRLLLILALALLALSSFCADKVPTPLVQPNDKVLVLGDSISTGRGYGYNAINFINKEYPDMKLTWLEHGHPGWHTKHAMDVIDDIIGKKPNFITIMFGTNDLGSGGVKGVAEIKERLRTLMEPLMEAGIKVVLLTTPYTSDALPYSHELNISSLPRMGEYITELGKELNVPVFDMYAFMKQVDEDGLAKNPKFLMFNSAGDCHPNNVGHQLMGRALADFLMGKSIIKHKPFVWKYSGKPKATAKFAEKPVDLTAIRGIKAMVLDNVSQIVEADRWKGKTDLSANAYAAWDKTNLYLTVDVTDDVIMASEKQPAWGFDGIEFFFDTRSAKQRMVEYAPGYFQMLVAVPLTDGPAPVACGGMDTFDPTIVVANCTRSEGKYRLQIAVPWAQLKFTPKNGADIGFDFAINDKDQTDKGRYKSSWRGNGDNYVNAGSTGKLKLER